MRHLDCIPPSLAMKPIRSFAVAALLATNLPLQKAAAQHQPSTTAAITVADLMSRISAFADDSMRGRRAGTTDALRAADYITREAQRIGLRPAGEHGTYFQNVPFALQTLDSASTISASGHALQVGTDWIALGPIGTHELKATYDVVYGGVVYDTLDVLPIDSVKGRLLVLRYAPFPPNLRAYVASAGYARYLATLRAAEVRVITFPQLTQQNLGPAFALSDFVSLRPDTAPTSMVTLNLTDSGAAILLGRSLNDAARGATHTTATVDVKFKMFDRPGRNVIAVLPGNDRKLMQEYVALGAHLDHIGTRLPAVDHDSMRAYLSVARVQGADGPAKRLTAEDSATIRSLTDSLHRLRGQVVMDSINNGADDDGSGSMGLLEIAEEFAANRNAPRRSLLFVWHTGEESGMLGSQYFTDHPTVPRDSIVAQLNVDMIGRGRASDVTGRNRDGTLQHGRDEGYVQIIGSRRLSTELGDLIDSTKARRAPELQIDYALDVDGHPQNIYCRSDHWEYARYGIAIAFFTTGGHRDYHQVTDEPQYLYYQNYRRVTQFIHDVAEGVANLDHRPLVDKPVPGPSASCRQ
jgi:hypothetical protein